jgi:hypothetical protein
MVNENSRVCCECTPVGETRFGKERGRPPSLAIIEALAAIEDTAPEGLDPPLYDAIDLEAVDQLFTDSDNTPTSTIVLQFSIAGWNVFVRDDGVLRVCDPDRPTDPSPVFQRPLNG